MRDIKSECTMSAEQKREDAAKQPGSTLGSSLPHPLTYSKRKVTKARYLEAMESVGFKISRRSRRFVHIMAFRTNLDKQHELQIVCHEAARMIGGTWQASAFQVSRLIIVAGSPCSFLPALFFHRIREAICKAGARTEVAY